MLASILFGDRELQIYLRWQTNNSVPIARYNALPTAFEYAEFQSWRNRATDLRPPSRVLLYHNTTTFRQTHDDMEEQVRLQADGWVLATICHHPLHPSHPDLPSAMDLEDEDGELDSIPVRCPVCTIRVFLDFQAALYMKWEDIGGPWRLGESDRPSKYSQAMKAFYARKVCMINTVMDFEECKDMEEAWERENAGVDMGPVAEYSAKAAVEMFWRENSYPEFQTTSQNPNSILVKTPSPKKSTKKVDWTPDTPEDTAHRPQVFYYRDTTAYDLNSKFACPKEEGWEDTSMLHDYEYNISQCRILLCFKSIDRVLYRELNFFREHDNPHVERLVYLVNDWLSEQPLADRRFWIRALEDTSDIFLVWKAGSWADDEKFDAFEKRKSLKGTEVEQYARSMGDWDEERDGPANVIGLVPNLVDGEGVMSDECEDDLTNDPAIRVVGRQVCEEVEEWLPHLVDDYDGDDEMDITVLDL
ncbi:hypothetical protein BDV96DRAFT_492107 [Lophiotrema nucula]|uniref:Uncharacterized protein n=1 Tax=Lophiotrema nucula TaxID=690887 RepID=A0A6A5Z9Z5_9PLEO|nr:hypothetical protein BDV96DRAFT_492107 [Lophiotrema nucula]